MPRRQLICTVCAVCVCVCVCVSVCVCECVCVLCCVVYVLFVCTYHVVFCVVFVCTCHVTCFFPPFPVIRQRAPLEQSRPIAQALAVHQLSHHHSLTMMSERKDSTSLCKTQSTLYEIMCYMYM